MTTTTTTPAVLITETPLDRSRRVHVRITGPDREAVHDAAVRWLHAHWAYAGRIETIEQSGAEWCASGWRWGSL